MSMRSRNLLGALGAARPILNAGRTRSLHHSITRTDEVSLKELYAKFQDPTSHYHIPPGTSGPEHEEDHRGSRAPATFAPASAHQVQPASSPSSSSSSAAGAGNKGTGRERERGKGDRPWLDASSGAEHHALAYFNQEGHDTVGVLRWPVAWGDCDMFQHVNNTRYLGWFESARIRYAESWASQLPEGTISDMLHARGTGFILKDVAIKYRAPVTYPDTIMISSKLHSILPDRASFSLQHLAWSMKDERVTAICDSTIVMYDYDNLRKGKMIPEFQKVLENVQASYGRDGET